MPDLWYKTDQQIWKAAEKKSGKKARHIHVPKYTGLWIDVKMEDGSTVHLSDYEV